MGRDVKRVKESFDWPMDKVWWGYNLPQVPCGYCHELGRSDRCPVCYGDGWVCPEVEPPSGKWYQVWETVSEGSPISPPFETPQALGEWMAQHSRWDRGTTPEQWVRMIERGGWAPSLVVSPETGVQSGVEFVGRERAEEPSHG